MSFTAGTYIVANQGYHPDAKLSSTDQEHSVRSNAVSFGTHHFGKWKLKLQVPPQPSSCATKLNGSMSNNTIILASSATRTSYLTVIIHSSDCQKYSHRTHVPRAE